MNENHLVHIPSCSATKIIANPFVRFCQRLERLERFEQGREMRRRAVSQRFEGASKPVGGF
jgi:hypothetical protein